MWSVSSALLVVLLLTPPRRNIGRRRGGTVGKRHKGWRRQWTRPVHIPSFTSKVKQFYAKRYRSADKNAPLTLCTPYVPTICSRIAGNVLANTGRHDKPPSRIYKSPVRIYGTPVRIYGTPSWFRRTATPRHLTHARRHHGLTSRHRHTEISQRRAMHSEKKALTLRPDDVCPHLRLYQKRTGRRQSITPSPT